MKFHNNNKMMHQWKLVLFLLKWMDQHQVNQHQQMMFKYHKNQLKLVEHVLVKTVMNHRTNNVQKAQYVRNIVNQEEKVKLLVAISGVCWKMEQIVKMTMNV